MKIKKPKTKEQAKLLFIELGWWILEQKYIYYNQGSHKMVAPVNDTTYDKLEGIYKQLGSKLKLPTSACDQVGFPHDSPSGKMIAGYIQKNGKGSIQKFS